MSARQRAEMCKEKGNKAFTAKNYDLAIKNYTDAISIDPSNHVYFSNRSAAYVGKNMYAEALNDAEQCVKLNKRWGKGYYRKAVALLGLSRAVEAEAVLKEGLTVDPNNNDIKAKLTEVSAKVKDLLKFTAPDGTPLTGAALVKAEGNDHFKNGRTEQAIACYSRAIELSSDPKERSVIYSNRAACWSQQQNWHGMLEDANLAIKEDDTNVKAYIRRALAYEGLEKYKLAIADFKKVLELDPNAMIASKGIARLSKFTY